MKKMQKVQCLLSGLLFGLSACASGQVSEDMVLDAIGPGSELCITSSRDQVTEFLEALGPEAEEYAQGGYNITLVFLPAIPTIRFSSLRTQPAPFSCMRVRYTTSASGLVDMA